MGLQAAGLSAAAALALAGCAPDAGRPAIPLAACHRVALADAAGRVVVGAEDLAADPAHAAVLVSAYDRLAVERALDAGAPVPAGGLYRVPLTALARGDRRIAVADLLAPALGRATRPHGVASTDDGGRRVAVVARDPAPDGRQLEASVLLFAATGARFRLERRWTGRALCRLNDLDFIGTGAMLASLDRETCAGSGPGAVARLDAAGMRPVAAGLDFPNGVAVVGGRAWVAETRSARLRPLGGGAANIPLPGAPDNLTVDGSRLVVAIHPSLWRFALHRFGWPGGRRAPSRVVEVDPATRRVTTLLDDPDGRTFSGATVALRVGRLLVVGGVRERGLLACAA